MKYLATLGLFMCACGSDTFIADDSGPPPDSDGGDSSVVVPPNCDLTKDPSDSPACVADGVGLFVSPAGADANPGTMEAPLATIDAAVAKVPKRIYVCSGDYATNLVVKSPVGIYGGFDCAKWMYGNTPRPRVRGSIVIKGTNNVSLLDLEVDAPDAQPGNTSFAVEATNVQVVLLKRVKLVAGAGGRGADGMLTPYTFPTPLNGMVGGASSSPAVTQTCPDGSKTVGGKGNRAPSDGDPGSPGGKANGGTATLCVGAGVGGMSGDSAGPTGDGMGASMLGALTLGVWIPTQGLDGPAGIPGQGGGGGSAAPSAGTFGASGGAGGCGGAGGGGGKGGGGSFGLIAVTSDVTVRESSIAAANAGNGGSGVVGQGGQLLGGSGGARVTPACGGGPGGAGGPGGGGGGGAGGISAAILYKPTQPTLDGATMSALTFGMPGAKGAGAVASNNGIDGAARQMLACQPPLCQ